MTTIVKVKFEDVNKILKDKGLTPGGDTQKFFTGELMRLSDPYTPFAGGLLLASARMADDGTAIDYNTPYARLHWYGKLMVDPKTGKGACFSPEYGFWSRPGVQKVKTNKDMKYQGAPLRGPHWVERAYIDNKEPLATSVEEFMKKRR